MTLEIFFAVMIPFLGTSTGAACVFVMGSQFSKSVQKILTGFAAGIMVAASVWSLLIPSPESSFDPGKWAFVPAVSGFWFGTLFLLLLDYVIPHLHLNSQSTEGLKISLPRSAMIILAVTLHNIPEAMAVGVVIAGWLDSTTQITLN